MQRRGQNDNQGRRSRRGDRHEGRDRAPKEFEEKVVSINPVSKTVKGGRTRSFSALVVVGDGKGRVGAGLGKAKDVAGAIRKAVDSANKNLMTVPLVEGTLPHEVTLKFCGAKVLLKPARRGTGVIAGGPVRAVLEAAGVRNVLTKSLGSNNPINLVKATMQALQSLRTADDVARLRGKTVEEILG